MIEYARLLTTVEVAKKFGVTSKTVARWAGQERIECLRTPGGRLRFYEYDVEEMIARGNYSSPA